MNRNTKKPSTARRTPADDIEPEERRRGRRPAPSGTKQKWTRVPEAWLVPGGVLQRHAERDNRTICAEIFVLVKEALLARGESEDDLAAQAD